MALDLNPSTAKRKERRKEAKGRKRKGREGKGREGKKNDPLNRGSLCVW
jgi:hypothetical protein